METPLSEAEQKTGRRYSSEAERRLLAWARAELPERAGEEVPEGWDPDQATFLRDLDGRVYGPTTPAGLQAALAKIEAELSA